MARFLGLVALLCACAGSSRGPDPAGDSGDPVAGFRLVRELGCTSCHAGEGLEPEPAPRIEGIGARRTPVALEAALAAGPRMPDCLAGIGRRARDAARAELVHFLASLGGPLAQPAETLDALTIERGRQLYHSVGCVACHEPFERAATLATPLWEFPEAFEPAAAPAKPAGPRDPRSLIGIGERTTREALARYLVDPLAVHPSGRMPSLALGAGEAADLAAYLVYEDAVGGGDTGKGDTGKGDTGKGDTGEGDTGEGDTGKGDTGKGDTGEGAVLAPGPGLLLDHYEASFGGDTADFDALVPVRSEVATSFFEGLVHREEDFGFRFRGLIEIATAGPYRFFTTSDDGSMLYLDGELVVDNRGQHAMDERSGERHLAGGRHAFELTYFEHFGGDGLEVRWSGPGFEKRELGFDVLSHLEVRLAPRAAGFALDPELVERGRERFEALGCARCHTRRGEEARALADCDPRRGCLAREPKGAAPRYRFAPGQRADLIAAVAARTPPPRADAERLHAELVRLECGACHARDALAGPTDERRSYFQVARDLDLGDEGRLPPSLERVGAKLKPTWFAEVLERGGRARPYMKTRMPQFGAANVAHLPELFATVDAALRDEREPEFTPEAVEAGKLLAGTKGLGCIQCHELAGHPSIGIPAVDLATVHERLYPGWFRELLMDPIALKMNTRMPAFWVDGKSPVKTLYDGDPAAQVDALWTYLSLGSSMPLPHGLVPLPGEYEVEVYDEPVCVGVFMEGVSPRTVCVGLPERVHYAFDVQNSRLALAWRGRFLDATGTWYARAGQLEKPAGEDVLEFPTGPALARLAEPTDPWPTETHPRARGWHLAAPPPASERQGTRRELPVFRYELGDLQIGEWTEPMVERGGANLLRRFACDAEATDLYLRVAVGDSVERAADAWVVKTGGSELRVLGLKRVFVVESGGRSELRMPMCDETATARVLAMPAQSEDEPIPCIPSNWFELEYEW